ncbi:MAG: DUF3095 domain-containing protein [Proteobacteria bacterium]|nr:DUF3095 domain-containing protein [Pseudomonadota bacterium]
MPEDTASEQFYANIPLFRGFEHVVDPGLYHPLPPDWWVGVTDIVRSGEAIHAQRYKAVNTAGAAAIAAVANARGGHDFPFVFGGDGAGFAVPPSAVEGARAALAATATWVREDLGLALRIALVPVANVRSRGFDVSVARYAPSPDIDYAMFSGGGLRWADSAMKRGEIALDAAPAGTRPDLSGLSCRFSEILARNGVILSLIVVPAGDIAAFYRLVRETVATIERSPQASRPIPDDGPALRWPPPGLDLEARATRDAHGALAMRKAALLVQTLMAYVVFRFGIRVGGFDPRTYVRQVVENSDYRKYDDGLRMIIDCTPRFADTLERSLADAATAGACHYGTHRQDKAMMTCYVPSHLAGNHVHFIDGAMGGYAAAARVLKDRLAENAPA